jgi:hypothetical protein
MHILVPVNKNKISLLPHPKNYQKDRLSIKFRRARSLTSLYCSVFKTNLDIFQKGEATSAKDQKRALLPDKKNDKQGIKKRKSHRASALGSRRA